jgi:hypothetical protein
MTELTESFRPGAFILSMDDEGNLSRDNVTVKSGEGKLLAGQVLGSIPSGTSSAAAKSGGNTGNGVFTLDATTPILPRAEAGVYQVRCIAAAANSGTFRVTSPAGVVLGDVAVGSTFADRIKFAIADGATDFIVGDGFDVTVSNITEKYVAYDETATNGAQLASGVLYAPVDATSADQPAAAVKRHVEVNSALLQWKSGATTAGKNAALAALKAQTIVAR